MTIRFDKYGRLVSAKEPTREEQIKQMFPSGFQPSGMQTPPEPETTASGFLDLGEPEKPKPTKVITDEKGRAVGIETPSGRTLLGLKPSEVRGLVEKQQGRGEIVGAEEFAIQEQQERATAIMEAERGRLVAEESPRQTQLNPEELAGTGVPLVGGMQRASTNLMADIVLSTVPEGIFKEAMKENLGKATDEELRQIGLTQIQINEVNKGTTNSEKIGEIVEAIPGGKWLDKWFDVETPRGNLEEVMVDIKSMRRRVMNIETNVKLGYLPIAEAQRQIDDIENYINVKESRLKLLISRSPSLNFNSDRVNSFETDILIVREKLFQSKLNVLTGIERDPTQMEVFLKLQEQDTTDWSTEEW